MDFTKCYSKPVIEVMSQMSFSAREIANAAAIYQKMIEDPSCSIILSLAGSTSAAGCMEIYADIVKYRMVDAIVAIGASIVGECHNLNVNIN